MTTIIRGSPHLFGSFSLLILEFFGGGGGGCDSSSYYVDIEFIEMGGGGLCIFHVVGVYEFVLNKQVLKPSIQTELQTG